MKNKAQYVVMALYNDKLTVVVKGEKQPMLDFAQKFNLACAKLEMIREIQTNEKK